MSSNRIMTKGERDDLVRLVKQRERVAKTAAEQRSAAMLAEFEQRISAVHSFNKNEIWQAAVASVNDSVREAMARIEAESEKLGIPEEFRPKLSFHWQRRGENEYEKRREELRRVAKAEIEAIERAARVQIETQSVAAQTEIISTGLSSDAAIAFLNKLPAIEHMMPALDLETIQRKLADKARQAGHRPYLITGDE